MFTRTLLPLVALATLANAATVAIDPSVTAIYGPLIPTVFGWEVSVNTTITVTALGSYWNGQAGWTNDVGLWTYDANRTLLASATVTTADTLIGGFYFHSIAPVTLNAGSGYTIGAWDPAGVLRIGPGLNSIDPRIDWAGSTYEYGDSLTYPTNVGFPGCAYYGCGNWGGNFLIAEAGDLGAPEPGSLLLCGLGAAVILAKRKGLARR
jgi:hypothetical protein